MMESLSTSQSDSEFGVKVTVEPEPKQNRSLGLFLSSNDNGDLFSFAVSESSHSTSMKSIEAIKYSFNKDSVGYVKQPKIWSFIAAFSGVFLVSLILLGIIGGDSVPEIGLPLWVFQLILAGVFAIASVAQLNIVVKFLGLRHNFKVLEELEKNYGRAYILDLPAGRLRETSLNVQEALDDLVGLRVKNPGTEGALDFVLDARAFSDDTMVKTKRTKEGFKDG